MKSKSTYFIIFYCSLTLCSWIIVTSAYPTEDQHLSLDSSESFSNELLNENSNSNEKDSLIRNKRTIGFLRQLFPGLSQIIDRKIQQITRVIFRVVGRLILRGGQGGGGAAGAGGGDSADKSGGRRVSITLPTYPPFEDEEEEDSTDAPTSEKDTASSDQSTVRVNVSSTTASSSEGSTTIGGISSSSTTSTEPNAVTEPSDSNTIRRINRDVSDVLGETTLSISETSSTTEAPKKSTGLLSRLREMRSKRGSGLFRFGNGGGGSGNFLFDVIRLIAGSGTSPEKDEEQNAPRDERQGDSIDSNDVNGSSSSFNSDDSYTTGGIPGPLTRLFILANRGISNLIQDLILLCPGSAAKCERDMSVVVNKVADNIHKEKTS
ncbi:uncharacterized protein LOC135842659 isoform X2 [Planococcus citri]|uniref:uncharacterized protein LOC135842659 isoform X2 n=1 Tax=Planococcus citri TaxID=170843 RepID=UPI0031F7A8E3